MEVQGQQQTLHIPLGEEAMHIGRGLAADLHIDESSVSRRHAILVPHSSGARILDDRSANGTFVNGRRVQQADLQSGDVIVVGRVLLRYLGSERSGRQGPAAPVLRSFSTRRSIKRVEC